MAFTAFQLAPELLRAATGSGLLVPSPVQDAVIPAALRGADVLATAPTGSGKTVAFGLPLLHYLQAAVAHPSQSLRPDSRQHAGKRTTRALVLLPTRELAMQVGQVIRDLARFMTDVPKLAVLFGGVSVNPQMLRLRGGADVVVATPGRLLDLIDKNALSLAELELLVLDEADRLLDAGFADELERVLALLPQRRQTLLFSATMPAAVEQLAQRLLRDPLRVSIAADAATQAAPAIVQRVLLVDESRRTALLRHLMHEQGWKRVLVFVATQRAAERVAAKLYEQGIYATPFHGALSQGARTQVLDEMRKGQWDMVVTTDLAARGLDIAQLPVVLNYDLPRSAVDYVHRIGRTGRAGASGLALSFVSAASEAHMRLIEKRQGLQLERETVAGFEPVDTLVPPDLATVPGTGGIKGKRPSKKDKLRAAAALASDGKKAPGPGS